MLYADDPDKPPVTIDFKPPWPRISFMSGLRKEMGLQDDPAWPSNEALHTEEARQYFLKLVSTPSSLFASAFAATQKLIRKQGRTKYGSCAWSIAHMPSLAQEVLEDDVNNGVWWDVA